LYGANIRPAALGAGKCELGEAIAMRRGESGAIRRTSEEKRTSRTAGGCEEGAEIFTSTDGGGFDLDQEQGSMLKRVT